MKKIKRFGAFLLTFIMCLQFTIFTAFAGSKISINAIPLCLETIGIDDVPMVSIRDIYQCFGATITWQADTQEIVVVKEPTTIKFQVNSATALLNDVPTTLDHAIVQQNGITYMPITFVSYSLNAPINWNITDGIVEFMTNPEETQAIQERNYKLAADKAEQARLAEIARQQAEEQARQAEIARQQEEQARQAEIARQQAEQAYQAEIARQQVQYVPTTPQGNTVYITRTGKRYHYNGNCNGGTYIESTLEQAKALGLTPCNKCAK